MKNLKIYIAILMFIKQINISYNIDLFLDIVYKFIIVWFVHVTVEEFYYEDNKLFYTCKISFLSFIISLINRFLAYFNIFLWENIFLTLSISLCTFNLLFISQDKEYKVIKIILGLNIVLIGMFVTQYGYIIIPFMLFLYLMRKRKIENFIKN